MERERMKDFNFDYQVRLMLVERFGPRMDPMKTFDTLCKLKDGYVCVAYTSSFAPVLWHPERGGRE